MRIPWLDGLGELVLFLLLLPVAVVVGTLVMWVWNAALATLFMAPWLALAWLATLLGLRA